MTVVSDLAAAVLSEGGFDADQAQALSWLEGRHRTMVARSRCYRKTTSLGSTSAGVRDYALGADVLTVLEVTVAGVTYGNGWHRDLSSGAQGFLMLDGSGGIVSPEEDSVGAAEVALYPTPASSGDAIAVRGTFAPPALSLVDDSTLKVPAGYRAGLKWGAIADGLTGALGDYRSDLAAPFEQKFTDATEDLRREVRRRYRGPGPAQIRVSGFNA